MLLLLDVMDTLVRDPFRDAMPAFFEMSFEQMLADKHPDAWVRFERGEIAEREFLESFFADRRPFDHEAFRAHIRAAYRWMPDVPELLEELTAAGAELHVLSNYPVWYRLIEERLGVSRFVRWTFVSCETGVRKPEAEAFLGAARHLETAPGRCLFVDDRERNVEAARAVGMAAERFEGADALRRRLVERGVLRR